jgi:hypothetical protein
MQTALEKVEGVWSWQCHSNEQLIVRLHKSAQTDHKAHCRQTIGMFSCAHIQMQHCRSNKLSISLDQSISLITRKCAWMITKAEHNEVHMNHQVDCGDVHKWSNKSQWCSQTIKKIVTMLMNVLTIAAKIASAGWENCMRKSAELSQWPIVKRQSGCLLQSNIQHVCSTQLSAWHGWSWPQWFLYKQAFD